MQGDVIHSDMIGEVLVGYPAPTGDEVAFARHSDDARLNAYGYDGEWHASPPPEVSIATAYGKWMDGQRRTAEADAVRPHVKGVLADPRHTVLITTPGRVGSTSMTLQDLRKKAETELGRDREVYGLLVQEAEAMLAAQSDHMRESNLENHSRQFIPSR